MINYVFAKKGCEERVTFFFLDRENAESLKAETILRSIIRQSIDPMAIPQHVESQLRNLDHNLLVTLEDLLSLLRHIIKQSAVFFIFIDGLDECDAVERRALLSSLSALAATTSTLRIFIAGRDSVYVDLRGRFSSMEHVSMKCESLTSDIRVYVDASIQERLRSEELRLEDSCLLTEIMNTLAEHADGM